MAEVLAVNEYQISSLLLVDEQFGAGVDGVAPIVDALIGEVQVLPGANGVMAWAFAQSSFEGAAGTA